VEVPAKARSDKKQEYLTNESTEVKAGQCLDKPSCAVFSNPLPSELARECENRSLNRFAIGPAYSPATSYPLPATAAQPLVFGCYGAARWEKGSDIFQDAIKLILSNEVNSEENQFAKDISEPVSSYPLPATLPKSSPATSYPLLVTAAGRPLHFAIQWIEDFADAEGNLVQLDPWLKNHPQVNVIDRYFEEGGYERQLEKTDVMVLPYRSPYRLRVSRVVIEAMICGMPVIATRGTTLFEQAEEYGVAIECEEGSAESLAEAILEAVKKFDAIRACARARATSARERFSVGYFRGLLEKNRQNH
jgi:glycosyltransferase involved in cell wall biosynthesis